MKRRLILLSVAFLIFATASMAQITDAEKKLKTINTDTIMGWKKGGLFAINLSQTSLTNWAA